jgi:hypothetical protein
MYVNSVESTWIKGFGIKELSSNIESVGGNELKLRRLEG